MELLNQDKQSEKYIEFFENVTAEISYGVEEDYYGSLSIMVAISISSLVVVKDNTIFFPKQSFWEKVEEEIKLMVSERESTE